MSERVRVYYKGRQFWGKTRKEAEAKRDEYIVQLKMNIHPSEMPVKQYAAEWLPTHKASVAMHTYNEYAIHVDRLIAELGDKRMRDVTATDIKCVYNTYEGKSESYIKKARIVFNGIFSSAVDDGLIQKNPCKSESAKPHHGVEGTHRNIENYEYELIRTVPHRMQIPALIMLYAGLRRGEMLALTWEDIDLDKMEIRVNSSVRFENNHPKLAGTKTEAGTRIVPIFKPLQPFLTGGNGFVCQSANGSQMTEMALKRAWQSYMVALSDAYNGFSYRWRNGREYKHIDIRCHDLRHSFCTWLVNKGIDMKTTMKWMGHADERMILRIYYHVTQDRMKTAIDMVNSE